MLGDGAIGRGDPSSVRHHFRDSVSDTMRIADLAAPRKIPREPVGGRSIPSHFTKLIQVNRPGTALPQFGTYPSAYPSAICHHGCAKQGGVGCDGASTACFRIRGERDCDRRGSEFGTQAADRIDESPPGIAPYQQHTDVGLHQTRPPYLGQKHGPKDRRAADGSTAQAARPNDVLRSVVSAAANSYTVIVIDTSPDLEHGVMKAVRDTGTGVRLGESPRTGPGRCGR